MMVVMRAPHSNITGVFADDFSEPGEARLCFLRSPYPHARISRIDTAAASALPGVVAIITGADLVQAGVKPLPQSADFRRADGSPTAAPPQHALAVAKLAAETFKDDRSFADEYELMSRLFAKPAAPAAPVVQPAGGAPK